MKKYEVILFDLVGVLVRDAPEINELVLNWTKLSEEELWSFWLRSPAVRDFDAGRIRSEVFAKRLLAELELDVSVDDFLQVFKIWLEGPYEGTEILLRELSGNYRLACLSNINEIQWPQIRDDFGLGQSLEEYFLSHRMGRVKPDKETFEYVVAELGVEPQKIVYFDDNEPNVRAAAVLGIDAHVTKGLKEVRQKLEELGISAG